MKLFNDMNIKTFVIFLKKCVFHFFLMCMCCDLYMLSDTVCKEFLRNVPSFVVICHIDAPFQNKPGID